MNGVFYLIIGPSGVGKGSVIAELKNRNIPNTLFPITATTRDPRPGELNGKDYFFISTEEFKTGLQNNEFLEHAIVHGEKYYGLPKKQVIEALESGTTVIRELDIQGFWNLKKIIPAKNICSIFLLPPSIETLRERILSRSTLPEEEVQRRLNSAQHEIDHAHECQYQIISEDGQIHQLADQIQNIITSS